MQRDPVIVRQRRGGARKFSRSRAAVMALLAVALLCAAHATRLPAAELRVIAVALFKDKAVLNIDGRQRVLRVGQTSPEGITLLAADADGARISEDGQARSLALDGRISSEFSAAPAAQVVRLVPGRQGHYFVDGQINGNPIEFLVDTGASAVAINKHTARRIGLAYRVDGQRTLVQTASGTAVAYTVVFDEVKIQALTLRRVRGMVIEGDAPNEALLGQSFLNRLDIHREGAVLELRER